MLGARALDISDSVNRRSGRKTISRTADDFMFFNINPSIVLFLFDFRRYKFIDSSLPLLFEAALFIKPILMLIFCFQNILKRYSQIWL